MMCECVDELMGVWVNELMSECVEGSRTVYKRNININKFQIHK